MPDAARVTRWLGVLRALLICLLIAAVGWRVWTLPGWLETQITREANATRAEAKAAIADTRKDVLGEVGNLRQDVMARLDTGLGMSNAQITGLRVDLGRQLTDISGKANDQMTGLRGDLNARLTDVSDKLNDQLTVTNTTLDRQLTAANTHLGDSLNAVSGWVTSIGASLKPALDHAAGITSQVNDALPLWLDCEGNPSCAFNLYQGTAKAFQHTAQNFDRITKPHWYDRLIGYGVNGAIIYRDLHPANTVVTLGTQVLSSRP